MTYIFYIESWGFVQDLIKTKQSHTDLVIVLFGKQVFADTRFYEGACRLWMASDNNLSWPGVVLN